ncbi:hypothetical protein D2Q93_16285 [Alicyclobacillaceae bacterium I2511]|nr:hypothetical protein D2Q93_16285 [Alicyclobacillaceae bacterium I2511]
MLSAVSQRFNRFIAFTDSRKQTEHIATILAREGQTDEDDVGAFPPEVRLIVEIFWRDSWVSPRDHFVSFDEVAATLDENVTPVIKPGSIGLAIKKGNQEVTIEDVFYHPMKELSYRVKYVSTVPSVENGMDIIWSVTEIGAIPGVTEIANYDTSTGRVQ